MTLTTSEKLRIIKRTWNLEYTGMVPYTIEVGQPHFATSEFFEDDAAELAWHEAYHDQRQGVIDFDMPNIKPNLGIGTIAAAFGCALRVCVFISGIMKNRWWIRWSIPKP